MGISGVYSQNNVNEPEATRAGYSSRVDLVLWLKRIELYAKQMSLPEKQWNRKLISQLEDETVSNYRLSQGSWNSAAAVLAERNWIKRGNTSYSLGHRDRVNSLCSTQDQWAVTRKYSTGFWIKMQTNEMGGGAQMTL